MASGDVTFEIPEDLRAEVADIAAELGIGVDELALQAFVAWVLDVRQGRLLDVDEGSGSNLDTLPGAGEATVPLEGTESWLNGEGAQL